MKDQISLEPDRATGWQPQDTLSDRQAVAERTVLSPKDEREPCMHPGPAASPARTATAPARSTQGTRGLGCTTPA